MTLKLLLAATLLLVSAFFVPVTASEQGTSGDAVSEEEAYIEWATQFLASLNRQTGAIALPQAGATLQVPDDFYYLSPQDAERVLVEAWGNPPDTNTLGMLFPADFTPLDEESWAVTVEYEEDGFVTDTDADKIDFDQLLTQMQDDTRAASEQRQAQGFEGIELIGWAADPYYDSAEKKLHWAKEIKFGDDANDNTLNYNIRVLGRKGVLVLNFIAGMNQQDLITSQIDSVLALAEFDQGSTYADFNPDVDKVAAYGIGALIAGKVIAKTGFLVVALVFLKKFGIFILLGAGTLLKIFFSRKRKTRQENS